MWRPSSWQREWVKADWGEPRASVAGVAPTKAVGGTQGHGTAAADW